VNEVIRGNPVMAAAVAVNGKVLAHVAASKLQCYPDAKSPSSVVRFIEHSGIAHAVETLLGHWRATGLIGFDFMLDSRGEASLIECNPRPTCLSYMGPVSGRRLCVALYHYLAGKEMPAPTQPRHEVVAHFPQEWRRDPQSDYLFNAFHDVPWDDPDLMHRLLKDCI
jgi:predicted ATP-grasp superfamily ATP-dependent carboligase